MIKGLLTNFLLLILFLSILISVFLLIIFFTDRDAINYSDYTAFATGALIIRNGNGNSIYNLDEQRTYQHTLMGLHDADKFLPYLYLPFFTLIFLPFTYLPLLTTYKILSILTYLLYLFGVFELLKLLPKSGNKYFLLSISSTYFPAILSVFEIQVAPIIFLVLLLVYISFNKKKSFFAGWATGLLIIKPTLILIIPFLYTIAKNKKKYILGFLGTISLVILISVALSGPWFLLNYLKILGETDNYNFMNSFSNMHSFTAGLQFLFPLYISKKFVLYLTNFIIYLIFLICFVINKRKLHFDTLFAVSIITTICFAIHVFTHDLLILFFAMILLLSSARKSKDQKTRRLYMLSAIVLYLFPLLALFGLAPVNSFALLISVMLILFKTSNSIYSPEKVLKNLHPRQNVAITSKP